MSRQRAARGTHRGRSVSLAQPRACAGPRLRRGAANYPPQGGRSRPAAAGYSSNQARMATLDGGVGAVGDTNGSTPDGRLHPHCRPRRISALDRPELKSAQHRSPATRPHAPSAPRGEAPARVSDRATVPAAQPEGEGHVPATTKVTVPDVRSSPPPQSSGSIRRGSQVLRVPSGHCRPVRVRRWGIPRS